MKKYLLAVTLALAGCLNTQTKDNLARPDFSKPRPKKGCCAPIQTPATTVAPVQTKTAMVPNDDSVEKLVKETDDWFKQHPEFDPNRPEYY